MLSVAIRVNIDNTSRHPMGSGNFRGNPEGGSCLQRPEQAGMGESAFEYVCASVCFCV